MRNPFESPAPISQAQPSVQIEDYLDHLCAPLIDRITYEQRLAIREEVRAHLLVLAASHEELGSSAAEALQGAMEQFGDPNQIGRSLSREYPRPFAPNGPLLWSLMHGSLGGVVGSIAVLGTDYLLHSTLKTGIAPVSIDCLLGFAIGWIPGVQLLRRPASPLQASIRTGKFYLAVTTALMTFLVITGPKHLQGSALELYIATIRTILLGMGINGAIGGAAMSRLFRRLQRFAPRSKAQVAR